MRSLESIEGIRVMRAYSRRDQQVKQFQTKTASLAKTGDKIASIQYSFGPLALLFIGVSTVLLLVFGGQSLASGQLSLGKLLALQLYWSSWLSLCGCYQILSWSIRQGKCPLRS